MPVYIDILDKLGNEIDSLIRQELSEQGHVATSKLLNSIRHEATDKRINGYAENYSIFVNNKSRPHFFNKKGVESLRNWLQVKGISEEALWPIIKKIQQEGTPTSGSYKFSQNGRRTDFVSHIINNKKDIFTNSIKNELSAIFGSEIKDILGQQKILK